MESGTQLQCRICKTEFTTPSNLMRHMNTSHGNDESKENTFECNICNISFSRNDNLLRHLRRNHEEENVAEGNEKVFKCPICDNIYQHKRTLRRHVKENHVSTGNLASAPEITSNLCSEPNVERAVLLQDCAQEHSGGEVNIKGQKLNPGNKSQSAEKSKTYSSKCEKCNLNFSSTQLFAKHYLECGLLSVSKKQSTSNAKECSKCNTNHNSGKECSSCELELPKKKLNKGVCVYHGCSETFFHRTRMMEHLEQEHFVNIESENFDFNCFDDFVKWKTQIENDTYTSFTAPGGKSVGDKVIYRYYTCQLEAVDSTHRKLGQVRRTTSRVWKERGRIPKGHYCPARMLVSENRETGNINVNFIETHNHVINYENYKYRKVPKATQDFILACLAADMMPRAIKHLLQGEAGDLDKRNGEVRPIKEHFIDEKYIKRLKYRLKSKSRFHSNDATSTDVLINYLMTKGTFQVDDRAEEFSPVTVYKPQGAKTVYGDESIDLLPNSEDLFLFGFQSKEQLCMLQQGAKTVVCLDFTYKITQYDFYLCNVIVPDEFGKGYPVAHFITNRQDIQTLTAALNSIKKRCPDLSINFLMTDDDQSEWQAMEAVFGKGIRRGICKYHLFRTWQRKLNTRDGSGIDDIHLRREVYHALTVLCHEKEESTFTKMLDAFKVKYRPLCPTFVKYFENEYSKRPHVWALCYRNFPHGHTDTNMYCESFHNKIKTFYLERKQNRRVDDLINLLQEAERDRYLEHLEMVLENRLKAEVPISHKRRHARGIAISDDDVSCPDQQNQPGFWVMKPQSSTPEIEEYFITRYRIKCELDHCYERCPEDECQQLCSHLYTCTCADASALCKHIHKVHSLSVRLREFKVEVDFIASNEEPQFYNPEPVVSCEEDNSLRNVGHRETFTNQNEKIRANCMSIMEDIQRKLSSTSNTTMLQFFQKQLTTLQGHSNAFSQSLHSHELEKIVPTVTVSGPQKVVAFKDLGKFYRTTKQYVASTENKLTKPTYEQRKERKRSLLSLSDREEVKRAKNEGPSPSTLPCSSELVAVVKSNKIGSHSQSKQSTASKNSSGKDSRSFTPQLGYTSNIHEPVLFFDGQDSHTSSVTFRALKSLDPFVTSAECKSLNVTGVAATMSSNFRKGWIFDEVINAYFDLLSKRRPDTHYFSTLFSDSLNRGGSLVKSACQFNKQEVNIILIPVNITNIHWVLYVCYPKLRKIDFYDPIAPYCSSIYVAFHQKLSKVMNSIYSITGDWDLLSPKHDLQKDPINCGVYVCYYANCVANKKEATEPIKDINNFRNVMYNSLAGNCLRNTSYMTDKCKYCIQVVSSSTKITCSNCRQIYHAACIMKKDNIVTTGAFRCQ